MITMQFVGADALAQFMKSLPHKLEKATQDAVNKMGHDTAGSIVQAATFDNFTGEIRKDTKYVPRSDGTGGDLIMPQHGIWVDRAPAHYVSMQSDRPQLVAWGLQAREQQIREAAASIARGERKSVSLYVHPHPFIDKGFAKAQSMFATTLQQHLERAFTQS